MATHSERSIVFTTSSITTWSLSLTGGTIMASSSLRVMLKWSKYSQDILYQVWDAKPAVAMWWGGAKAGWVVASGVYPVRWNFPLFCSRNLLRPKIFSFVSDLPSVRFERHLMTLMFRRCQKVSKVSRREFPYGTFLKKLTPHFVWSWGCRKSPCTHNKFKHFVSSGTLCSLCLSSSGNFIFSWNRNGRDRNIMLR